MGKKNKQSKVIVSRGKDEMNLIEFPITLLSRRNNPNIKFIEFSDTITGKDNQPVLRRWKVIASEYGMPLAQDNDVLLALLCLGNEYHFESPVIYFHQNELFEIMRLEKSGTSYEFIKESLRRLKGVSVEAEFAFFNNGKKAYENFLCFGVIDNVFLSTSKSARSYVKLNEYLYNSIKSGYIRSIDTNFYFSLKGHITKRLFRYLDMKKYNRDFFEQEIRDLCYNHLGFNRETYKYLSSLKAKMDKSHNELYEKNFLRDVQCAMTADGDSEKYMYSFYSKSETNSESQNSNPIVIASQPVAVEKNESESEEDKLLKDLVALGITKSIAQQLIRTHSKEVIENQIKALPFRNAKDPPAVLLCSIQGNWAMPPSYVDQKKNEEIKKVEKIRRQEEEEQKAKLRRRVEQYISSMSEEERLEYTNLAREAILRDGGNFMKNRGIKQHLIDAYIFLMVEKKLNTQ